MSKRKNSCKLKIPLPPPPPHHFSNGPSLIYRNWSIRMELPPVTYHAWSRSHTWISSFMDRKSASNHHTKQGTNRTTPVRNFLEQEKKKISCSPTRPGSVNSQLLEIELNPCIKFGNGNRTPNFLWAMCNQISEQMEPSRYRDWVRSSLAKKLN